MRQLRWFDVRFAVDAASLDALAYERCLFTHFVISNMFT
jgi:hypothetical protein